MKKKNRLVALLVAFTVLIAFILVYYNRGVLPELKISDIVEEGGEYSTAFTHFGASKEKIERSLFLNLKKPVLSQLSQDGTGYIEQFYLKENSGSLKLSGQRIKVSQQLEFYNNMLSTVYYTYNVPKEYQNDDLHILNEVYYELLKELNQYLGESYSDSDIRNEDNGIVQRSVRTFWMSNNQKTAVILAAEKNKNTEMYKLVIEYIDPASF